MLSQNSTLAAGDDRELHVRDKPFVRAVTHSVMHVPVNMGSVFARVNQHIDDADASADGQFIVLSRDLSPWIARDRKSEPGDVYFFYTTCPKCAKAYGKNYVVGITAVA